MMENEQDIKVFSDYTKVTNGLYVYTEDGKNSFYIYTLSDGKIKTTLANNSIEEFENDTRTCDSLAVSALSDQEGIYKVILVGYGQFKVEQFRYTFFTNKEVKEQIEYFVRKYLSYIVDIDSNVYQCIYEGMKLRVEYLKPNSGFEELVQASIFEAMKGQLCNYKKWFNEPYMRDPIHFGSRINPNAIVLDKGGYLLNGEEYDKGGNRKQKESD